MLDATRLLKVWLLIASMSICIPHVFGQGFAPEEAARRMQVAEGLQVQLVVSEPMVRQPVAIEFDDLGRLWVIQYLQYPNPAELNRVQVDRYSRTKYDRFPEPPPRGPKGTDRITILEDLDGDGLMDQSKDFVNGLNLASGIAFGHDGVFVLNVPYLLFYADRNRDDVPDGEPEVLLSGFGMEDAHSVANSLTWGPDGWLYGCQGSTVTANIQGIEFQQGVWRYHPTSRKFELFCEGGGNSWGLDFDRLGNLYYSTNYGGHVLLHGLQGAYFVKSFAKHGELHNPFAFGYFDHAPHTGFQGGHVTVGGIVYQGDSLPKAYRDKYIAGDLLGHRVCWHDIQPHGSTVRTLHGGEIANSNDTWFAPTDLAMGPDGSLYVSDWCDQRTAHPDPDAQWDRSNGRIYRISAKIESKDKQPTPFDFSQQSIEKLLEMLGHSSQWCVRHSRQELIRRHVRNELPNLDSIRAQLKNAATTKSEQVAALESLWVLHALDGLDESTALLLLNSKHPSVRAWTIRLLGDRNFVSAEFAHRLDELAEKEMVAEVRQQLACTAARLPANQAMPIINANINRDIDNDDPRIPLLWWWAVERHSVSGREEVMRRFLRPNLWKSRLGTDVLMPRLIRRYAAEGIAIGYDSIVRLIRSAPSDLARDKLWLPVLQGLQQQTTRRHMRLDVGEELSQLVISSWRASPENQNLLRLAAELHLNEPIEAVKAIAFGSSAAIDRRVEMLDILARTGEPDLVERSLELLQPGQPEVLCCAAIRVLSHFDSPKVAEALIAKSRSSTSDALRAQIVDVLVGRESFAREWLAVVDQGEFDHSTVAIDQVRRVAQYENASMDSIVTKLWGRFQAETREEMLAEVRRLNNDLRAATGDPVSGQVIYNKHCATCHTLFGEGKKVGPDLTTANRKDRDFLLVSLVDPSSAIRKEYVSVVVLTNDGRVLNGLPISSDESEVTLVNGKNEEIVIPRSEIADIKDSPVSIMPSDLHRQFSPQQLRDLFSYLQRSN